MLFWNPVRITDLNERDGTLRGEVGQYLWEARLARKPIIDGLDPSSLYKGYGRIIRLVVFEKLAETEEGLAGGHRPWLFRKVASYDRGWYFGRRRHLPVIQRIVQHLERSA